MPVFEVDEEYYVDLLRRLVRTDTCNPPGRETEAVRLAGDSLAELGCAVQYFEPETGRTSAVARLPGQGGGRNLLLNGHVDTGPVVDGWTKDPWAGARDGRRLYGHGVGDMKAGIAAMVAATRAVVRSGIRRRGDLVLMVVADESSGGHLGSGHVVRQMATPAVMAIVCEPARGAFVRVAHRGAVWAEVTVTGRSGQGAKPETGVNAIELAARAIGCLYDELRPMWRQQHHPLLPPPSLNVGMIEGGLKPNMIPGQCRVRLDRRTLPGERVDDVLEEIRRTCDGVIRPLGGSVNVREILHVDPGEVDPAAEIVSECRRAFEQVTGRRPEVVGTGGFTDAHWLIDHWKIPTVSFGPWYLGSDDQSVTGVPDEWIDVDDALTGTRVYASLVANIVG
jgi:acetylornithine deacetylase/succinyl-diaminopimelate desuccinylase-like protein